MTSYFADIKRAIDGDTLMGLVDCDLKPLGISQFSLLPLRLVRINTEEINSINEAERIAAQAAKAEVERLVLNKTVRIDCYRLDPFKRPLVEMWIGTLNLSTHLLAAGFGKRYTLQQQMRIEKWYDVLPVNEQRKIFAT
jgi:endonuclease YncB( thermonuclease family)